MRKLICFLGPLALLQLAGCATTPPPPASAAARIEYGAYPENHEQIVKDYFAKSLAEPAAAQYRIEKPFAGYIIGGPLLGGKVQIAGYFVELRLTAKDSTGTSRPERHLGLLIFNGEVLMELTPPELANVKRAPYRAVDGENSPVQARALRS